MLKMKTKAYIKYEDSIVKRLPRSNKHGLMSLWWTCFSGEHDVMLVRKHVHNTHKWRANMKQCIMPGLASKRRFALTLWLYATTNGGQRWVRCQCQCGKNGATGGDERAKLFYDFPMWIECAMTYVWNVHMYVVGHIKTIPGVHFFTHMFLSPWQTHSFIAARQPIYTVATDLKTPRMEVSRHQSLRRWWSSPNCWRIDVCYFRTCIFKLMPSRRYTYFWMLWIMTMASTKLQHFYYSETVYL